MGNIRHVIFFKNAVETLGYFSEQIAIEMEHCGIDTYFVDYHTLAGTVEGLPRFVVVGKTAVVTFNFIGFCGEDIFADSDDGTVWQRYNVQCFNILVDHPMYYHARLERIPSSMIIFCIDREHVHYIKRFYPGIEVHFLPIAGNVKVDYNQYSRIGRQMDCDVGKDYDIVWNYQDYLIPYEKRAYDLVFTANYVTLDGLYEKLDVLELEYRMFYRRILAELLEHPDHSVDAVMEKHLIEELGELADTDKRMAMSGMILVDLCARAYFRGEIIRELAENEIRVHVFGADWDRLCCKRPENIIKNGAQITSSDCVQVIRNAKIALNILPWFKDGAHDRIFTAMLQKTVALTDDSRYLLQEFTDGQELVFFSLQDRECLPGLIQKLLENPENAMRIAECGYQKAYEGHTWRERAQELMKKIRQI